MEEKTLFLHSPIKYALAVVLCIAAATQFVLISMTHGVLSEQTMIPLILYLLGMSQHDSIKIDMLVTGIYQ
jgi:hypothetical protein